MSFFVPVSRADFPRDVPGPAAGRIAMRLSMRDVERFATSPHPAHAFVYACHMRENVDCSTASFFRTAIANCIKRRCRRASHVAAHEDACIQSFAKCITMRSIGAKTMRET